MLEMRFAGHSRFIAPAPTAPRPANFDATPARQPMAAAAMPDMPVSGVNWTRHQRPQRATRPKKLPAHLTVIK